MGVGHKLYVKIGDNFEELSAIGLFPDLKCFKKTPIYIEIAKYLKNITSQKKSSSTRKNEKTYFSNLYEYLIDKQVFFCDEVNELILIEYRIHLLKKVKQSTVNRQFNTIKNFFNLLLKNEVITKNPCINLRHGKVEKPRIDLWSGRDFVRVRNNCDEGVKDILNFIWYTGARSCEAVNLTWADINYDEGVLFLRSEKNNQVAREVIITKRVDRLLHNMKMSGIFVFGNGSKFTSDSLGKKVRKIVQLYAENKNLNVKGIRHTFCMRAVEKGLTNRDIQLLMGHASWRTTENYTHFKRKHLKKAAESL